MKKVIMILSAATLAFTGAIASAQAPQGNQAQMRPANQADAMARANQRFQSLDANRDGRLTQAELQAGKRGPGAKAGMRQHGRHGAQHSGQSRGSPLARIDANGDGMVTLAEFQSHVGERFAKHGSNHNGQR